MAPKPTPTPLPSTTPTSSTGIGAVNGPLGKSNSSNGGMVGEKSRGFGGGEEQTISNEIDKEKATMLAPLTSHSSGSPLKTASGMSMLPKLNLGGDGGGEGQSQSHEGGEGPSLSPSRLDKSPVPPPLKLDFSALSPGGVQPPASPSKALMSAKGLGPGPGPGFTARTLLPTSRAPPKNTALALAHKRRPLVLFPEENDSVLMRGRPVLESVVTGGGQVASGR